MTTHDADVARLAVVAKAVADLDAEHRPDPSLRRGGRPVPQGCVICWPKDGSWPCISRMIADDLRAALEYDDGRK